ncbi:bifunctional adenosylcobinamide kinase/adenosylcobinamide-phosphate guanylyltransferase [Thermodesulfobacteriota bacterium]
MQTSKNNELVLVLGGARSGKSSWALRYVEEHYNSFLFMATAEVRDQEMAERIRKHKASRGPKWDLLEESLEISEALNARCDHVEAVLIDCLTIWLSNVMLNGQDENIQSYQQKLLEILSAKQQAITIVSNEVGSGIVPQSAMGREFRDQAGLLNQRVAAVADKVILMIAGFPLYVKNTH